MKAKWGAIVVDGRGKLGGHVASRNSAGAYFRTKVTPVNPSTSFQEAARQTFADLSQAWRDLTEDNRSSWNSAVSSFAKTDIFGDLKSPSGFNLFQRLNNNLSNIGQAQIDTAPAADSIDTVTIGALSVDIGVGDAIEVAISAAVPGGTFAQVWATPALSPGVNFVKSEFRLIESFPPTTVSPLDFQTEYLSRFGSPSVGSKVFCQIKFVDSITGQASPFQKVSTIVLDT